MTQDNHYLSGKEWKLKAANSQRPPEFYQLTQVQILEDQT